MGFSLASLSDSFADNSVSTSAWVESAIGSATVAETSAEIRFTLPSSTAGTHIARLTSRYVYDLTGSSFYVNIDTMVATGVAATAFFQLYLNDTNALQWIQVSNTLYARHIVAGVSTDEFSATWNATNHKYLRIRESGGNIEWHSSANGTSWTLRGDIATPFTITDLYVDFGATCGNIASPGSFRIEDVNLILPALSTNWRWTNARRALVNRHKRTTIAIDTANTAQGYIVTADGVDASDAPSGNIRYWSGPAGGGRLLTEAVDEATAQAAAVNLPLDGTFDLPEQIDMRLVRLGHRSIDGSAYTLREFYPRRLVQSDDIEAESIRAINIAARQITADHIAVIDLNAESYITAGGGVVVLDDDGMTITGDAFDYDLSNISPVIIASPNQIKWTETTADQAAAIAGSLDGQLLLLGDRITLAIPISSSDSYGLDLNLNGAHRLDGASFAITAGGATGPTAFRVTTDIVDEDDSLTEVLGDLNVDNGLNVGTATGAGAGDINASDVITAGGGLIADIEDAATTAVANTLILRHRSTGTPAAGFGHSTFWQQETSNGTLVTAAQMNVTWVDATNGSQNARVQHLVSDTAAREYLRGEASGSAPMIGFLGANASVRTAITGVRTGTLGQLQTVMANLLSELATKGLITDSTT